jgi:hypothetical protein
LGRQFSDQLLEYIGGPCLQELTVCGASELPEFPDYLDAAAWNVICGVRYYDLRLTHLAVAFVRQSRVAVQQYKTGRNHLLQFVNALPFHKLSEYLLAVDCFEHCIGAVYKAVELELKTRNLLLPANHPDRTLFKKNDGSDLHRINALNNIAKHWSADQSLLGSAPIWITNNGLASSEHALSFAELVQNIVVLNEICHWSHVELPKLARARAELPIAENGMLK